MNIIAISYKDDYHDRDYGYGFGSKFEITAGEEYDVLQKLIQLEMNLAPADTSYEHYVIIEGCVLSIDSGEMHYPSNNYDDSFYEYVHNRRLELRDKLDEFRYTARKKREEEVEQKRLEEVNRRQKEEQAKELRILKSLKEKYPDA